MKKTFLFIALIFQLSLSNIHAQNHIQLWGTTSLGGVDNFGTIFHYMPNSSVLTTDYSFQSDAPGSKPGYNELIDGGNGKLYGTAKTGGLYDLGVIFEWDPITNLYSKKVDFNGSLKGSFPEGSLAIYNGKMYGMTSEGGTNSLGTIFEWDPITNIFTKKVDFSGTANGSYPLRDLVLLGNKFYGMTFQGGINNLGSIFEWDPTTNVLIKKIDFDGTLKGSRPYGNLTYLTGKFYGMTYTGGTSDLGVIFEWDNTTNAFLKKQDFNGTNGSAPLGSLKEYNGKLYGMTLMGGTSDKGTIIEWDPITNILLKKFNFADTATGVYPYGNLTLNKNNKFYGLTSEGGVNNIGTLFEWDPASNSFVKKQNFELLAKGSNPFGNLTILSNKFYGMTFSGGISNMGTIFEWTLSTNLLVKKIDFNSASKGGNPYNSLLYLNSKFYGTTNLGGINENGAIFNWNPLNNTYTKNQDFSSTLTGNLPYCGLINLGTKLYGLTSTGGTNNLGAVFEFDTTTNIITKKLNCATTTGSYSYANLTYFNGKFYGMTNQGGTSDLGTIFEWNATTNIYTKKQDFTGTAKGATPYGNLVLYNLKYYGLTYSGGTNDDGAIFEWDPTTNIFTKKIDFAQTAKGNYPDGSMLNYNGKFYGTTTSGGSNNFGVIFEWDPTTNVFIKKIDFDGTPKGSSPTGSLTISNGIIYGVTNDGGLYNKGVLYKWNPTTNLFTKLVDFNITNGANPKYSKLIEVFSNSAPIVNYHSDTVHVCISSNSFTTFGMSDINLDTLSFSIVSSNPSLITNSGILISTLSSNNYRIDLTPISGITGLSTITITANDGYGGITSFNFVVNVHPKPTVGVVADVTDICEGNSVTLNGTGASTYIWSNGITNNVAFYPTVNGTYYVTGSDIFGCSNTSQVSITVHPLPIAAGTISGSNTVCQGQSSVNYSVLPIANATTYIWTFPNGATGSSSTDNVAVDFNTSSISGNITVMGHNSCGNGAATSFPIIVNPLPVSPTSITGLTIVCQGQNAVTYSVLPIDNAITYLWTTPIGAIGTSSSNSITIDYGTSAISGNITVKGHNTCGDGVASSIPITVNPLPVNAGSISGFTTVCQGQNSVSYTVAPILNATSYVWSLPSGATGVSSTNNIIIDYSTSALSGNISVKGHNSCGDGISSSIAITVNPLPLSAGNISGFTTVCQGQNTITYSVAPILNATSYTWTLPSGASGTSSTSSIIVNYSNSATSGLLTVKGHNDCGDGMVSNLAVTVNPLPANAGTIVGSSIVCQGQNSVSYSIAPVAEATSYIWTLPNGAIGNSSTNSITINYNTSAISGNISVKGHNSCGDGIFSTLAITVNPLPVNATTISGNTVVCQGQSSVVYSIPAIAEATSYIWTLPTGASGVSSSNSITVDYSTSAISGNISVKGHNNCGDGGISNLAITVNPLPALAGAISGLTTVCQGQGAVNYSVSPIQNATSYSWTLVSGAIGSSSINNISVDYGSSATSGNIIVKGNNSCGYGVASSLAVIVNPLPYNAGVVTGESIVCQGQSLVLYSIATIPEASSYTWTIPSGATGSSSSNNISLNFTTTAVSGNIIVKGHNSCGDGISSSKAIIVNPLPELAGAITGLTTVCQGQNTVSYSITPLSNATSYVWTLPSGASGSSTTNSILVNFGTSAIPGNISVKGHNACGDGIASTLSINVNPLPSSAGAISGLTNVCQGQSNVKYIVPQIANASSYVWTLQGGASGNSSSDSIKVNYAYSAVSDNISVKGFNSCGNGPSSSLAINVIPIPNYPLSVNLIQNLSNLCAGDTVVLKAVPTSGGNSPSFQWFLNGAYTGISDSVYSFVPQSLDSVYCIVTSSLNCLASNIIKSEVIPFQIAQNRTLHIKLFLEGLFYNNAMVETMDGWSATPQWGFGIADKVTLELHQENDPYTVVISQNNLDLLTDGTITSSTPCANRGDYYIGIKTRNHLQTWSRLAIPFNLLSVNYDFTTSALQAYGQDAQVQVSPNVYAFYLGDLDQFGWVDSDDYNIFEPNLTNGDVGFLISDFNGDGWVDSMDYNLVEPRLTYGTTASYPTMKKK